MYGGDDAIKQITASAKLCKKGADEARIIANRALPEVSEGSAKMQDIQKASKRITAIVDVDDRIALGINILSLNASVTTVKAGKAGKGFAVVASEIRSLAVRSADVSRNIAGWIEHSAQKAALARKRYFFGRDFGCH